MNGAANGWVHEEGATMSTPTAAAQHYPQDLTWPKLTRWKSGNSGTPYVFDWLRRPLAPA